MSSSDCYPASPAGPCVAGSPVGSDDYLQVLEPLEHSVLDHVDPAGQHTDVQNTVESLEHSVLDNILDGRPMDGITCPELLEYTLKLLDTTLDGGLVEKISGWEPAAHPVLNATLDGRHMEVTTTLENSVLVESLDSRLTEGMLSPERLEQSVLNTLLVARPMEGYTETNPLEHSTLASQLDYGPSNLQKLSDWEPAAHQVPNTTLDGRPMEGTTKLEHSVLVESLDSGLTEWMLSLEPLEQSVLNTLLVSQPTEGSTETKPPEHSALALQLDYGHSNLESLARPMVDVSLDRRPMEGLAVPLPVSGPRDGPKH